MTLGPLRFTNALGGTADWIYPGPAIDLQSPASAQAVNGTTYLIYAEALDRSQWEIAEGAYTSSTGTFSRTTILFNSLGTTAKINFADPPAVSIYEIDASTSGFLQASNNLSDVANEATALNNLGGVSFGAAQSLSSAQKLQAANNIAVPSGAGAQSLTQAQQSQALSNIGGVSGGFVNKFRNGAMDIGQRGTSGTVGANSSAYTLDGWILFTAGAACSWNQEYYNTFGYSNLRLNAATGLTGLTLVQRIESYIANQLLLPNSGEQPITIQFQIYNGMASAITPQLLVGWASAQDNFATVTADLAATNLQTIAAGTFGTVAYTYTPSNGIHFGMQIQLAFGGALNAASGLVRVTACDIRATPGLATGLNSSPPAPEVRPLPLELQFCQRYYETSYDMGTAPGTATHVGMVNGSNMGDGTNSFGSGTTYRVPKRSDAVVSIWDGAGNAGKVSRYINGAYGDNFAAQTVVTQSRNGFMLNGAATLTVALFHFASTSEL